MQFMIAWCREGGLRKVWLRVFDHNRPAIALYESLGFSVEGRLKGEVLRGDASFGDVLHMGKLL